MRQTLKRTHGMTKILSHLVELVRIIYVKPLPMRRCIPAELRGLALRNLVVAKPSLGVNQHLKKLINSSQFASRYKYKIYRVEEKYIR
jgi:hypothetical protein